MYKYLFKGKCKKGTIWGLYWRLDCKRKISFSEATTYSIQFFSTCIGCCVCWAKKKLQSKLPSNIFLRNSQHVLSTYTVHLLHSSCTFSQNSHWDRYFRKSAKSIPKRRLLLHTKISVQINVVYFNFQKNYVIYILFPFWYFHEVYFSIICTLWSLMKISVT